MAPLLVLVVTTALARLTGWADVSALASWPTATAAGLVAMFCLTASAHFVQPRRAGLLAMVPPRIGRARELVTLTGVLELVGAVGLLVPATRFAAALCLGLLLIAVFPANVYATRAKGPLPHRPATLLGRRATYQVLFLAACAVAALA